MKILQITAHFSPNVGGVETHLDDLVKSLIKRKNDVFVLSYQPLQTKTKWEINEKSTSFEIFRIPWITGLFYFLVDKPILEFIYLFPGLFIFTPLVLLKFNPKVIHVHGLIAGAVGVFWAKIFNKRIVVSLHSIYHFPSKGLYRNVVKLIFDNSDMVLTLSQQSGKEIEKVIKNKNKIKIFTYWIDLNLFKKVKEAKQKLNWERKFVILFVGRLIKEKGITELIKSVRMWNKKITLAMIGSGPMEKFVISQQSKTKNMIFLGMVDNKNLPLYYSACDLLVIPSVHEEGFGRVILESLACGTPIIGSRRGAIPEAMDETVGKLIKITPKNIKESVEYFYKNSDKLANLSKNTRKFAVKRYSENNAETIIKTYAE